jgi:hypothetical protein
LCRSSRSGLVPRVGIRRAADGSITLLLEETGWRNRKGWHGRRRLLLGKRGLLCGLSLSLLRSLSLFCGCLRGTCLLGGLCLLLCGLRLKRRFRCFAGLDGRIAKRSPGWQGCIRVAGRRRAAGCGSCYARI